MQFLAPATVCMQKLYALVFPITTVGDLAVVAHSDVASAITTGPDQMKGTKTTPEVRAELLLRNVFHLGRPTAFLAGWLNDRTNKVIAAPMPFEPPVRLVIRTPEQRRQRNQRNPGVYFIALSALTGCALYDGAATALARVASFHQTVEDVVQATLTRALLLDTVRFRFGAREVTDVVRGHLPVDCGGTSLQTITARSWSAEALLRTHLLAFVNPLDHAEELYLRQ